MPYNKSRKMKNGDFSTKGFMKMKKIISLALCAVMIVACVATLASCSSKKYIGVQSGTTGQYFVDGDMENWGFEGLDGYEAKGYNNAGLAVKDLKSGAVKYVITDAAPAKELAKSIGGVKVIDIALTEEEYAFGVDKNQTELLNKINNVLTENKTDVDAIFAKYANGEATPVTSATKDLSKADKQLVVATNAEFAPFEYTDGDKYVGIDIEIMKLVADKLNMELVIENMDFDAVVTSVGKNGVDVAAAALTVNDTRKESVNFTKSYYNAAQVVITLDDDTSFDKCKTADDVIKVICGK